MKKTNCGDLILQGADGGMKDFRDGSGLIVAITENSWKFLLSPFGVILALVKQGACTLGL